MLCNEIIPYFKGHVKEVREGEWMAQCPCHKDDHPSLSITEGKDRILLHCFARCKTDDIVEVLGLKMKDLFFDQKAEAARVTHKYDYCDEQGSLLYQVCRKEPKGFFQRRPDGQGGWINSIEGVRRVPYLLRALIEADPTQLVFIVEGEKDVDRIRAGGLFATTNSGGEGAWAYEFGEFLRNRYVVIVPDNDDAGRDWTTDVVRSLEGKANSVRIPELQGLPASGDVSDWLDMEGNTIERLKEIAQQTPAIESLETYGKETPPCLAFESNILNKLEGLLDDLGLAGERRNAKLLYLAVTSRLTDRPVSIWVSGPSSSGKSFLVETVLKAFPKSAFYTRSAMSEKALIYSEEPLSHRYLVFYELAGINSDFADYILRSLLSEGRIKFETTVKGGNGQFESRLIEKEGPTGLILTTTKQSIHTENATRMWRIEAQSSEEQTRAVLMMEARRCGGSGNLSMDCNAQNLDNQGLFGEALRHCGENYRENPGAYTVKEWIALQEWIETAETRVFIPYALWIATHIGNGETRLRRDFPAVLNLIKAHAILHQENRERDGDGCIIANPDDYRAVYDLVAEIVGNDNRNAVPEKVREMVLAVQRLEGEEPVLYKQLESELVLDKSNVSRHVQEAIELEFLKNEEKTTGKLARIRSIRELPDERILPSPNALDREWEVRLPLEMAATAQQLSYNSDGMEQMGVAVGVAVPV